MQRDINLFSVYRSPAESERGLDKVTIIGLSLVGACILGVAGTFAYYKLSDVSYQLLQRSITGYLQSSNVKKAESSWAAYVQKLTALKSYQNEANAQVSAYKKIPVIDSTLLSVIAGAMPADIKTQSLAYAGNALTLTCTATDNLSPANFVHTLKETGKFDSVTYSSVTLNGTTELDFTVKCTMKAVNGK